MHTRLNMQTTGAESLGGGVGHVCFCVLYCDTQLLRELLELLQVLSGAGSGRFVTLLEELGAVLGHGVHDVLELL